MYSEFQSKPKISQHKPHQSNVGTIQYGDLTIVSGINFGNGNGNLNVAGKITTENIADLEVFIISLENKIKSLEQKLNQVYFRPQTQTQTQTPDYSDTQTLPDYTSTFNLEL